ncbi:MAG: hypothetical protein ACK5SX_10675 [Sandaracinobacter sp.]
MAIAVAIDGAYFLRRFSWSFPDLDASNPSDVAKGVEILSIWHLAQFMSPRGMERGLADGE